MAEKHSLKEDSAEDLELRSQELARDQESIRAERKAIADELRRRATPQAAPSAPGAKLSVKAGGKSSG